MARTTSYPTDFTADGDDKVFGTNAEGDVTKNLTVEAIAQYVGENIVPVRGLSMEELKMVSPNGTTYTLLMSDTGQLLTFLGITGAPFITGLPVLSGDASVGSTLTATAAPFTANPEAQTLWQWQRKTSTTDWNNIIGETTNTYAVTLDDFGAFLRIQQIATNIIGTVSATSASTAAVGGNIIEITYVDPLAARVDTMENNTCLLNALTALSEISIV